MPDCLSGFKEATHENQLSNLLGIQLEGRRFFPTASLFRRLEKLSWNASRLLEGYQIVEKWTNQKEEKIVVLMK